MRFSRRAFSRRCFFSQRALASRVKDGINCRTGIIITNERIVSLIHLITSIQDRPSSHTALLFSRMAKRATKWWQWNMSRNARRICSCGAKNEHEKLPAQRIIYKLRFGVCANNVQNLGEHSARFSKTVAVCSGPDRAVVAFDDKWKYLNDWCSARRGACNFVLFSRVTFRKCGA